MACGTSDARPTPVAAPDAVPSPSRAPSTARGLDPEPAAPTTRRDLQGTETYLARRSQRWARNRECALSCHTTVPFAIALSCTPGPDAWNPTTTEAREGIRRGLGGERTGYAHRIEHWEGAEPWYDGSSSKVEQSRGTEAVLNAIAARIDGDRGREPALANLAGLQRPDGGWDWLDFGLAPWEDAAAEVSGTALALIALADAPPRFAAATVAARGYIRAALEESLGLHELLTIEWASQHDPQLLPASDHEALRTRVLDAQRSDGGWSSSELRDTTRPLSATSDASATAYAAFVLIQREDAASREAARRALDWLAEQQRRDGSWVGTSMNSDRRFNQGLATDQATAYAYAAFRVAQGRRCFGVEP